MTKWVKAIQAARANRKEKTKSKLPTVKNIYWHLKLMADGVFTILLLSVVYLIGRSKTKG